MAVSALLRVVRRRIPMGTDTLSTIGQVVDVSGWRNRDLLEQQGAITPLGFVDRPVLVEDGTVYCSPEWAHKAGHPVAVEADVG
jgi:hypothetical protein